MKPNDPNVAPPFVDPREVLEGEPQVEEGFLDDMPAVPALSRRESVPAEVEEVPAAGNLEEDETMDVDLRGDEDDDDMELGMIERLDHCIYWYHLRKLGTRILLPPALLSKQQDSPQLPQWIVNPFRTTQAHQTRADLFT